MKNNFGLLIVVVICLFILGIGYVVLNLTQSTEPTNEPELQSKSQKPIPVSSTNIKSDQGNIKESDSTKQITNTALVNDTESSNKQDLTAKKEVAVKEKSNVTHQAPVPAKPFSEMSEEELTLQLQVKNAPEQLIEVINRFSTLNKISDKSIDQLKGFIGKKNSDVDAYLIKALTKKATERDDVLSDLILILKTNDNKVTKRCAADAIGEFKNANQKLTELKNILNLETDERVKLKLSQTINRLNDPSNSK